MKELLQSGFASYQTTYRSTPELYLTLTRHIQALCPFITCGFYLLDVGVARDIVAWSTSSSAVEVGTALKERHLETQLDKHLAYLKHVKAKREARAEKISCHPDRVPVKPFVQLFTVKDFPCDRWWSNWARTFLKQRQEYSQRRMQMVQVGLSGILAGTVYCLEDDLIPLQPTATRKCPSIYDSPTHQHVFAPSSTPS